MQLILVPILTIDFYSRPCGRGDKGKTVSISNLQNFYSRPCGRGDLCATFGVTSYPPFLLTPLREGRLFRHQRIAPRSHISTHAPAGGATFAL